MLKAFLPLGLLLALLAPPPLVAQHGDNAPSVTTTTIAAGMLEAGVNRERVIKGGEAHTYHLRLAAGDFLRLRLEQRDVDLRLTLAVAGGARLAESDTPLSSHGFETVVLIAEAAGEYQAEVRANKKNAPPTAYAIRVEALRPATAQEARLGEAFRAIAAADTLFKKWTNEAHQQAIERYRAALDILATADDRALRARALKGIGLAQEFIGEYAQAAATYETALPLLLATDDRQEPAFTLNEIARSYAAFHQYQKAIEYRARARQAAQANAYPLLELETLTALAQLYNHIGEPQKAINLLLDALALARAHKATEKEAQALNFLGSVYHTMRNDRSALYYFTQALSLIEGKNRYQEAFILTNLGQVHRDTGDPHKALDYFNRALPIFQSLPDRFAAATVMVGIGALRLRLQETEAALAIFDEAVKTQRQGNDLQGVIISLNYLGITQARLNNFDKALAAHREALALSLETNNQQGEITSRYYLASVESRRDNLQEALSQIGRATWQLEGLRSRVAIEELRTSLLASFQKIYGLQIDLLMRSGATTTAFEVNERFRARSLLDSLQEAQTDFTRSVDRNLLNQERGLMHALNRQADNLTRLLARQHTPPEASEARRQVEVLTIELQALRAKIRQTSPRYAELTNPQPLNLAAIQQQIVDEDSLLLEYALGEERSYLWAITRTKVTTYTLPGQATIDAAALRFYRLLTARNQSVRHETVDEKRARLAAAEVELPQAAAALSQMLLAPVAAELQNRRLLVVSDGALQYIPFAALPRPLAEAATSSAPPSTAEALGASHEIVYLPSASTLEGLRRQSRERTPAAKTVAIFADPVFDRQDERLARAAQKPSAATVAQSRQRANRRAANGLTRAVGRVGAEENVNQNNSGNDDDSNSGNKSENNGENKGENAGFSLPRIPYTRQEAKAIAALAPPSQRKQVLDFDANKAAVLHTDLRQFRFLHFATHGFLNTTHPELSGIALSLVDASGREQDGFLRAHEIYNLDLPVELVVLSGCRTGLGKEMRGEGLIGLTRGFMYAGAARVLVSLWDVNDEATAEFMARFYQAMLGKAKMSPAAALRAAQSSMAKDRRWSSPYYWAAFVLQGEPD